jgi:hypothetical protein
MYQFLKIYLQCYRFIYKNRVNYLSLETYFTNFVTYHIKKKMDTEIKLKGDSHEQIPSIKDKAPYQFK